MSNRIMGFLECYLRTKAHKLDERQPKRQTRDIGTTNRASKNIEARIVTGMPNSALAQQLEDAEKSDSKVQAWFRVTTPDIDVKKDPAEKIAAAARKALNSAKKEAGEDPDNVNIQPLLGTFTVYARPAFLRVLLKQPDIAPGGPAHVPGFGLIKPVEAKPAIPRQTRAKTSLNSTKKKKHAR